MRILRKGRDGGRGEDIVGRSGVRLTRNNETSQQTITFEGVWWEGTNENNSYLDAIANDTKRLVLTYIP
jgi:hypothetical protein